MNTNAPIFCSLLCVSLLSGCSSFLIQENSAEVTDNSVLAQSESTIEKASQSDASDAEPSKPFPELTASDIESFPSWFDVEAPSGATWYEILLDSDISLSKNLSDHGIQTQWIESLRRADYIDLATIKDNQVIWVEAEEDGSVKSLYAPVGRHSAYYLSQTESGLVMSRAAPSPTSEGSFELTPETKLEDLTEVQRHALHDFLSNVLPLISHEAEVLLSEGVTHVFFEYMQLKGERLGQVRTTMAESQFNGYSLTYKPERFSSH